MKTVPFIFVAIALSASVAFAQGPGIIGIFSDAAGTDCDLFDTAPGLCTYHVVHAHTNGATASMFAAPGPACFLAPWIGDTTVFGVNLGDSQNGISIGYGFCYSGSIHILSISYFCQGLTPQCCMYSVVPSPYSASGQIEVTDCDFNIHFAFGWTSPINPDQSCCCFCTPVEKSTWGKVKSLYER